MARATEKKLRVEGRRTSKERVRRLMREHDLQAPQRAGHAHGPKAHDGTITTEAPDVMWGTDMTATVTVAEGPAFVFVAVDHCTAECIGLHAAKLVAPGPGASQRLPEAHTSGRLHGIVERASSLTSASPGTVRHWSFWNREAGIEAIAIADIEEHSLGHFTRHLLFRQVHDEQRLFPCYFTWIFAFLLDARDD